MSAMTGGILSLQIALGVRYTSTNLYFWFGWFHLRIIHFIVIAIGLCPEGRSWFDKADVNQTAHRLTQCSNAGLCDPIRGECACFPGFSGNACQRSKS